MYKRQVFLVLFLRSKRNPDNPDIHATRPLKAIPLFVLIFVALWIVAQFNVFKEPAHQAIFAMVQWDFSLAAAALGLSCPIRNVKEWGLRGVGLTCAAGILRLVVLTVVVLLAVHFNLVTFTY